MAPVMKVDSCPNMCGLVCSAPRIILNVIILYLPSFRLSMDLSPGIPSRDIYNISITLTPLLMGELAIPFGSFIDALARIGVVVGGKRCPCCSLLKQKSFAPNSSSSFSLVVSNYLRQKPAQVSPAAHYKYEWNIKYLLTIVGTLFCIRSVEFDMSVCVYTLKS